MAREVFTGWRTVRPGVCFECGSDDAWQCDGRGNVMCDCQACPDCGIVNAYGFHNSDCPCIEDTIATAEQAVEDGRARWAETGTSRGAR